MSKVEKSPVNLEEDIVKNFNLHRKWKKAIIDLVKGQVSMIEEPEEWSDLLEDWSWFRDPHPWVLKTLDLLARYPAASAYLLANYYLIDEKLENEKTTRRDIEMQAARFRRIFIKLHRVGLVHAETIFPGDDTVLRNAVTIWVAPFAKEKDIQQVKDYYRAIGGTRRKPEKVDKKSAKDVSEHNRKVKVIAIMDRFRESPQLYDYFQCPKKHPEGFKTPRKPQSSWKKQKYVRNCKECGRELVQISHKEFMKEKYKSLCDQWDVKP